MNTEFWGIAWRGKVTSVQIRCETSIFECHTFEERNIYAVLGFLKLNLSIWAKWRRGWTQWVMNTESTKIQTVSIRGIYGIFFLWVASDTNALQIDTNRMAASKLTAHQKIQVGRKCIRILDEVRHLWSNYFRAKCAFWGSCGFFAEEFVWCGYDELRDDRLHSGE